MKIIWKYLKPFKSLLFLAMGLAAIAQVLDLIDPIIFGARAYQRSIATAGPGCRDRHGVKTGTRFQ
jgi:hypothetical protein